MGRELFPRQSSCAGHGSHRTVRHSWAMPRSAVHRPFFREDACQGISSQTRTKGRRAASPNPSQTTTAVVITARGYSCKPDPHRRKKNQPSQPDIKRSDKTWRKFTLLQKNSRRAQRWATSLPSLRLLPELPTPWTVIRSGRKKSCWNIPSTSHKSFGLSPASTNLANITPWGIERDHKRDASFYRACQQK